MSVLGVLVSEDKETKSNRPLWSEQGQRILFVNPNDVKELNMNQAQYVAEMCDKHNAVIESMTIWPLTSDGTKHALVLLLRACSRCAECSKPIGRDEYLCDQCKSKSKNEDDQV